jgi:hypothetical protein
VTEVAVAMRAKATVRAASSARMRLGSDERVEGPAAEITAEAYEAIKADFAAGRAAGAFGGLRHTGLPGTF